MKRIICFFLVMVMITVMSGCGGSAPGKAKDQPSKVKDVIEEQIAKAEGESVPQDAASDIRQNGLNDNAPAPDAEENISLSGTEGIDVDLTSLSSTIVYSEVYNMMVAPEDYIGKIIKMSGTFKVYYDEEADKYYYACIIQDATACCSQGIEFVLADERSFPEEYPKLGTEITVIGSFSTYMEGKYMYVTLLDAELL